MINDDEKWMNLALQEASKAEAKGEIPVGAVLIIDGKLIAKAHNQSISKNDATAHAEIELLRKAGKAQKNYRVINSTIYSTLEPCAMCFGAMVHARVKRIVFGASDPKTGVCGSCIDMPNLYFFNHQIDSEGGILEEDCRIKLQKFFKGRRYQLN